MKWIFMLLCVICLTMQYEIWMAPSSGILAINKIEHSIKLSDQLNAQARLHNKLLIEDIRDLKNGHESLEAHARYDLGMVKPGEVFYQVISQ